MNKQLCFYDMGQRFSYLTMLMVKIFIILGESHGLDQSPVFSLVEHGPFFDSNFIQFLYYNLSLWCRFKKHYTYFWKDVYLQEIIYFHAKYDSYHQFDRKLVRHSITSRLSFIGHSWLSFICYLTLYEFKMCPNVGKCSWFGPFTFAISCFIRNCSSYGGKESKMRLMHEIITSWCTTVLPKRNVMSTVLWSKSDNFRCL